jgi:predicted MFS family arabinose efflux permease
MYLTIRSLGILAYVVRVLDGAATVMWYTALFIYAADLVPVERRTEGLAIFGISGVVAIGLGAQMGEVILSYTSYRGLFLGALVLAGLGLMMCFPLQEVPPTDREERELARHVLATTVQRNLIPVWLAALAFFVAVVALFTFMKTFVTETGASSVGAFFGAYAVVAVALRVSRGAFPNVSAHDARWVSRCRVTRQDLVSCPLRTRLVESWPPGCSVVPGMAIRFPCS